MQNCEAVDILAFEIESSWQKILGNELKQPYLIDLAAFLEREKASGQIIFPSKDLIFNAFRQTPFDKVNIVIVGQDPYHGEGQAHGLSFSVPKGTVPPPSLKNIYKELGDDVGISEPAHGCLISWAQQGVLLLNTVLTVRKGDPLSHKEKGWERFTDAVIAKLFEREEPIIFLLWGKSAQEKCEHIEHLRNSRKHVIFKTAHPSPYSAQKFFGCRHFSKANQLLIQWGRKPIDWEIR